MEKQFKTIQKVVELDNDDVREFAVIEKKVETKESLKARRLAKLDELPSNCDLTKFEDSCGNVTDFSSESFARFLEGSEGKLTSGKFSWYRDGYFYRISNGKCDLKINAGDLGKLLK